MTIVKTAAAVLAAAITIAVTVPAQAQLMAPGMPNRSYNFEDRSGSWINSANRDYYSYPPAATTEGSAAASEDYAAAGCTLARVPIRRADGRTVTRLRHICP